MNQEPNMSTHDPGRGGHHGHGLMMIACCIPMLVIAVLLVATGVASPGFLFAALACTAMMAFMMRGMSGSDTHEHHG
jgi:hypothetical protein